MWYAILGAVLLAGDQILKYWVVTHLAVGESAPFLPGFMQLTRLHNYGAAWSSFSGRTVLLVVFTAVLLAVVALLLLKKVVRHWTGVTACTLILSGGIGNIIDVQVLGQAGVLRTAVIFFYLSNEGVSLMENAGHLGLPIPAKLKEVLEQLHDRSNKEDTK